MGVEIGLKLPACTDMEIMMNDANIYVIEFMSRFEKFKVDETSIDEADDDMCFNAKYCFEDSRVTSLKVAFSSSTQVQVAQGITSHSTSKFKSTNAATS